MGGELSVFSKAVSVHVIMSEMCTILCVHFITFAHLNKLYKLVILVICLSAICVHGWVDPRNFDERVIPKGSAWGLPLWHKRGTIPP